MSDPYDHQWRVGFSHDLAPGQQTTVTLYLRPTAPDPKTTTCWVGLVEEWVAWHQDRIAVTQITFGGGSARDPIRDTFQAHPQLNEALFWLSGFRIEDVEAVRNEPLLNAALIAGNAVPIGRLLTKGYRFLVRGGREVIVDPSMHIVASAGIRAEKGYVGELYGLAVASQREGFRPLAGWLHGVTEHGPDALGRVFGGRPAVIESKFNCADRIHPSHLKDEVTTPWLMRYAGRAGPAAGEFSRSIANGTIVKMLVVTRCGEQAIGIAADALARFDVAYEVSETGRVLKRYAP